MSHSEKKSFWLSSFDHNEFTGGPNRNQIHSNLVKIRENTRYHQINLYPVYQNIRELYLSIGKLVTSGKAPAPDVQRLISTQSESFSFYYF